MTNFFVRQSASFRNDLVRSAGALIGIAQGVLCDGALNDNEVRFLNDWLTSNESLSAAWPGNVVHAKVREILADGVISEEERIHLISLLQQLIGGTFEDLASSTHVTELAINRTATVSIPNSTFCLTGEFVFAPRSHCELAIEKRGGFISKSVTKKVTYLVVGGVGSEEWKHGSFGTKVEKAIEYRSQGHPILIVHEDQWASAL